MIRDHPVTHLTAAILRNAAHTNGITPASRETRYGGLLDTATITELAGNTYSNYGYEPRLARLIAAALNRLWKTGHAGKYKSAYAHNNAPVRFWLWWASEGTCDQNHPAQPIECAPAQCLRRRGGCWSCCHWANANLQGHQ